MNFTQTHDIETSIIRKLDNPFTFSSPTTYYKTGSTNQNHCSNLYYRIQSETSKETLPSIGRVIKERHPLLKSEDTRLDTVLPPLFFQFRLLTPFRPTHSQGLSFGKARGVRLPWRRDPHNDTSVQPLLHARETSSMHS